MPFWFPRKWFLVVADVYSVLLGAKDYHDAVSHLFPTIPYGGGTSVPHNPTWWGARESTHCAHEEMEVWRG